MLIDQYEREDVFAQVPELAQETDPVLRKLDGLLDDDALYRASCAATLASAIALPWSRDDTRHRWRCSCVC